jgi:predicted dienelactone hydrolase
MLKKILLALIAFLVLVLAVGFILNKFSKIPAPFLENSQSAFWSENGKYKVSVMDFNLRDETRETQAHEYFTQFEGLPYRQFETTVWFPQSEEKERHPLIIYSHAFMSDRGDIQYILQHLSSRGYIVLAANYPLTNKASGDAILMADVVNQPADINFLINQITNPMTDIGKAFNHLIDENKIGVMGYSLGGLTSALAAYHPTYINHRIKAVVSIAGPSAMLGEAFYHNNSVPFMMVAGTSDQMTPFDDHAAVILKRINNSVLVKIDRGSHMGFAGMATFLRWANNPDSLACSLMNMKMDSMGITRGAAEKAWYPLLGTTDQGVIYNDPSVACNPDDAERKALNPLRQHMLAKVAIVSFFESVFSSSPAEREKAKEFLANGLEKENNDVYVRGKYTASCQPQDCQ